MVVGKPREVRRQEQKKGERLGKCKVELPKVKVGSRGNSEWDGKRSPLVKTENTRRG